MTYDPRRQLESAPAQSAPAGFDFTIEDRGECRVLVWSGNNGCRPATDEECTMWDAIIAWQHTQSAPVVPDVSAMARVLSDRSADACNIDRADNWAMYGQEYIEDVQAMLAAPAQPAAQAVQRPELTVWEGAMPESNGKSNFTAVLMRKGADLFDGISGGMTISRSEYPDRVRYEADCVRWLIGELDNEPCIIDYDADKHSGYVAQQSAPERVSVPVELLERAVGNGLGSSIKAIGELRVLLEGWKV